MKKPIYTNLIAQSGLSTDKDFRNTKSHRNFEQSGYKYSHQDNDKIFYKNANRDLHYVANPEGGTNLGNFDREDQH